jgi:hypothetical protein
MIGLASLLGRVQSATWHDRLIDAELDSLFRVRNTRPARPDDYEGKFGYKPGDLKSDHGFTKAKRYTQSVDYALALLDRRLPGYEVHLSIGTPCTCELVRGDKRYKEAGATLPLAIIAAMLSLIVKASKPVEN